TVTGAFNFLGTTITNVGTWFAGLFDSNFATKSTTDLAEGTNLYYTDGKVGTYLSALDKGFFFSTTSTNYWLTTKDTDDLSEGTTNLYFTDTRAVSALTGENISIFNNDAGYTTNTGTVTSVGLSAPTGFTVSNSPVTGSGTLTLNFADGYEALLSASS